MWSTVAMWGGVAGLFISIFAIIILYLTRKNILDILDKDVILFGRNFEIKKKTITDAFQIIDEIALKVEELKKLAKGKLTAWIIGGENIKSANGENTINTVNKIAGIICDRPDIDASILAGSKSGEEKIVLHTLSGQLEIILDKSLNKQHNLEDYFDIVELNNTDLSFTK